MKPPQFALFPCGMVLRKPFGGNLIRDDTDVVPGDDSLCFLSIVAFHKLIQYWAKSSPFLKTSFRLLESALPLLCHFAELSLCFGARAGVRASRLQSRCALLFPRFQDATDVTHDALVCESTKPPLIWQNGCIFLSRASIGIGACALILRFRTLSAVNRH